MCVVVDEPVRVAQSEAARWWLAGFLEGGEPDVEEYLGRGAGRDPG